MKIFLDCGYHQGQGLAEFSKKWNIKNDWQIHCWEPNPNNHKYFKTQPNIFNHREAVWFFPGVTKLRLENNNGIFDGWGSTLMRESQHKNLDKEIDVKTIDFRSWIKENTKWTDDVYIKMDIEGSEFPVLRRMIKADINPSMAGASNAQLILPRVKKIAVEFHERFFPMENKATVDKIIEDLSKFTKVERHW